MACFAPDLGREPWRMRVRFHRRRARLLPPGPLTFSERSTVDSNGDISLCRESRTVRKLDWLIVLALRHSLKRHSAWCECLQLTLANLL